MHGGARLCARVHCGRSHARTPAYLDLDREHSAVGLCSDGLCSYDLHSYGLFTQIWIENILPSAVGAALLRCAVGGGLVREFFFIFNVSAPADVEHRGPVSV